MIGAIRAHWRDNTKTQHANLGFLGFQGVKGFRALTLSEPPLDQSASRPSSAAILPQLSALLAVSHARSSVSPRTCAWSGGMGMVYGSHWGLSVFRGLSSCRNL